MRDGYDDQKLKKKGLVQDVYEEGKEEEKRKMVMHEMRLIRINDDEKNRKECWSTANL